jgi:hypothetical protein
MMDKQTRVCRFLQQQGTQYICKITNDAFHTPPAEKPSGVTNRQWEYYLADCVPYPNPNEDGHCPPEHILPPQCSFTMVRVED